MVVPRFVELPLIEHIVSSYLVMVCEEVGTVDVVTVVGVEDEVTGADVGMADVAGEVLAVVGMGEVVEGMATYCTTAQ